MAGERELATARQKLPPEVARPVVKPAVRRNEREVRKEIKAVERTIAQLDDRKRALAAQSQTSDAAEALKKVQPELARGVSRGVIHKNTAARKISRLSKRVASLG